MALWSAPGRGPVNDFRKSFDTRSTNRRRPRDACRPWPVARCGPA